MTSRGRTALAIVASILAAGCGGSDEDEVEKTRDVLAATDHGQIETTAKELVKAMGDEDYAKVCDSLTVEYQREQLSGLRNRAFDCEESVRVALGLDDDDLDVLGLDIFDLLENDETQVEEIEVRGDAATADVNGDRENFAKVDGEWKLSP